MADGDTMASVTSLDKDLRNLRLSKYTPQAANQVREWIEEMLHEKLPSGDLIDALKDGVILCRYREIRTGFYCRGLKRPLTVAG